MAFDILKIKKNFYLFKTYPKSKEAAASWKKRAFFVIGAFPDFCPI